MVIMKYQCDTCGKTFSGCQVFVGYMRILNKCSQTCYEKNGSLDGEVLDDNTKITIEQSYNGCIY